MPSVSELLTAGVFVPRPYVLAAREQETADTWTLTLEPTAGSGPVVHPGQFMMVYAFGIGEVPISVSGPPNRSGPVVLTIRAVGAVTRALCGAGVGAQFGLRGPFGTCWPVDESRAGDVVVVAGGIGLAPLRPAVLEVLDHRDAYGSVSVLYGARTPADVLYPALLDEWRSSLRVESTVDAASTGWRGHVGVVTKLIAGVHFEPPRTHAFVCGPEIMMRFAIGALLSRGVPQEQIHVSLERHMQCGVGLCGHCQLGPTLICRDGPVYPYSMVAPWLEVREL